MDPVVYILVLPSSFTTVNGGGGVVGGWYLRGLCRPLWPGTRCDMAHQLLTRDDCRPVIAPIG